MQCKEIIQVIEATFPRTAALGFDNVGLLAGRSEKEVSRIYLALDATDVVIDRAIKEGADMLITHHPLLFSAVKKVTDEDFITRRIVKLIQNDISYYAMHTNYDVLGMAELSGKIMDLQNGEVLDVTYTDEEKNECFFRNIPLPTVSQITLCMDTSGDDSIPYAKYLLGSTKKEVSTLNDVKKRLGLTDDSSDSSDGSDSTDGSDISDGSSDSSDSSSDGSGDGSDYSDGSDGGSSDDGSYDDGSYDDGSYDDGSEEY